MQVPEDLRYTDSHEWVRSEGETLRVGITEFAQSQLADLTFVDLPEVDREVSAGEEVAVVESVKAASDVYAPVAGVITAVNDELSDAPEKINEDPFGEGWLFEIRPANASDVDSLLDAAAYREQIPEE
jgi:glycine cleavage system H protein